MGAGGANLPPVVTLTAPTGGSTFTSPATVTLSATASDPDGTIAKVEFYQGDVKLGESTVAPFTFTWPNVWPGSFPLSAKAYDNIGAVTQSTAATIVVQWGPPTLPYSTDFETFEGYTLGLLHGQGGWSATGGPVIGTTDYYAGASGVTLPAASTPAQISLTAPTYGGENIVFVDLSAKLVAVADTTGPGLIQAEGAKVLLVKNGAVGELQVFDGNGTGGGQWRTTGFTVALAASNQTSAWLRITLREDFNTKKWDLYADGRMVAYDVGMIDSTKTVFSQFAVTGSSDAAVAIDSVLIGFENPLFVDVDKDGMDDSWERDHGLDPSLNDRNSDADGDGVPAIAELVAGSSPTDYFNGVAPQLEALNGSRPGPDDDLAMTVRRPDGTLWADAPVVFSISTGSRRISAVKGGPVYSKSVEVSSDANGVARAYLEPL